MSIRIPAKSFFVGVDEDDIDDIDFDTLSNKFPCIDADTGMVEITNATDAVPFIRFVMGRVENIENLLGVSARGKWEWAAKVARKRNYEMDRSAEDYIKEQGTSMRSFASRITKQASFSQTAEYAAHRDGKKALEDHYSPLIVALEQAIYKAREDAFPDFQARGQAFYEESRQFEANDMASFLAGLDENITGKAFLAAKKTYDELSATLNALKNAAYRAYQKLERERDAAILASEHTTLKAEQDALRVEWRGKVAVLDAAKEVAEKAYNAEKSASATKTNEMIIRLASEIVGKKPADNETTENKLAGLFLTLMLNPAVNLVDLDPEFVISENDWWGYEFTE